MARSFYGLMMQASRAAERSHRQSLREHARTLRAEERLQRQMAKAAASASREAKQRYLESRQYEVEEMNEDIARTVQELITLLHSAPEAAEPISFNALKKTRKTPRFDPSKSAGPRPVEPSRSDFSTTVRPPGILSKLFGGNKKYEDEKAAANAKDLAAYQDASRDYQVALGAWTKEAEEARARFEAIEAAHQQEIEQHNATIDQFAANYYAGVPEAVIEYAGLILDRSTLPEGFPEEYRLAYVSQSRQLIVEHWLPDVNVIPKVAEYTFIKSKDEIREKPRKKADVKQSYELIIAQTCLRIANELFASDQAGVIESLVLNGVVDTISPSTGEHVRPCIVSLRTTKEEFSKIVLDRVDPVACLRTLGAVSKKPEELTPVRPVLEFDMVDRRFVTEVDILSNLDSRPNIMELTPSEFENLVTNLFSGMGLDAKQTRSSRDGGVDAVAFDPRPVLGGKVVIQAKRYRNTVGVAAVRDLYGTMINEGANKGILVTTAGYGPDAFTFAKDKPIELLDGPGLLYLLNEQGIPAKIIMPEV